MKANQTNTLTTDQNLVISSNATLPTSGIQNIQIGNNIGGITSGNYNTCLGQAAGTYITTGNSNVAIGANALYNGTLTNGISGATNVTCVGAGATITSTSANNSTAIGASATTSGANSTAIGASAYASGANSTAIGYNATASQASQIVLGTSGETVYCPGSTASNISLVATDNISINGTVFGIGIGGSVGYTNSLFTGLTSGTGNGSNNTLYGRGSYIPNSITGSSSGNTIIGAVSMTSNVSDYNNVTCVGYNCNNSGTSVDNTTMLGSGCRVAGSNSTAIGYLANATLASQIVLGTSTETVYCPGNPTTGLSLVAAGGIQAFYCNTISDYRIKQDVQKISSQTTVDNLNPVTYQNTVMKKQDMGFIAHEVQEHFPFLVSGEKDGPTNQSINYTGFIALLTKEIQELKQRVLMLEETHPHPHQTR